MNENVTDTTELATFGAGCFWGVEDAFRNVPGVIDVRSGYEGGTVENPTYDAVCSGKTGHAEVVQIRFDPQRVDYATLLETFWSIHDPASNRRVPSGSSQYRSSVFYHSPEQRSAAEASKAREDAGGTHEHPVATEIVPAQTFYRAEEYHQRYFEKNGIAH